MDGKTDNINHCPYREKCKYRNDAGWCDDERHQACQLVEFGFIEKLIENGWVLNE
jgi:hypothetical protein